MKRVLDWLYPALTIVDAGDGSRASRRGSGDAASDKTARLLANARQTTVGIAASYVYDCAILFGFSAAGFIDIEVPLVVSVLMAAIIGLVSLAHLTRWSLTRRDPTLFLPHQIFAALVCLGVVVAAPQIGFQPLSTLFVTSVFGFLAPNTRSLIASWCVIAIGAAAAVFYTGARLAIPTDTFEGRVLTCAIVVGLLARCMWVVLFVHRLRRRLAAKNESLREAMARIEALALTDDVTGLANRRAITELLSSHIGLSQRTGLPLSIALVDVDHFKRINDIHGHLTGDRALKFLSEQAVAAIRVQDRIGRFGGEEFLIVLSATTLDDAVHVMERLRSHIASCDWASIGLEGRVTVTVGVAHFASRESIEMLLRRADLALYRGKDAGRNCVMLAPPAA
ncbi:sensor domain-containing diguanylate cyclase [Pararobbsia silviterrae]|uniref:diguanylate cyclase n=1 Tax=Pararobbsia silviterrae TaxID=1792498 RepID=A0A494X169_9BURK|nr:GGDEF domain-containing protein [Pararobbsia silviterrae]RKP44465.1 GGDEF domain-containing protein [Pararobbsia silviterrae]